MAIFKTIGRFETVIEAEELKIRLESIDVEAFVETSHLGSIMPYATQAMGGVAVNVKEEDFEKALEVLKEMKSVPSDSTPPNVAEQADGWMKRAGYAAVIGSFLLPVVSNLWSFALYAKALRMDPACRQRHPKTFIVGFLFNLVMLSVWATLGVLYLRAKL